MSELMADLRLPIALLRKAPFVYVGPDFRSLPLGLLSDIVDHHGRQIQRLNPLTVSMAKGGRVSTDLLFCFTFFYINDDDERVVFLTQPIWLTDYRNSEALEALLIEVERLAEFLESGFIEIEIHEDIKGLVAFPTSLSFLSYNLEHTKISKLDSDLLKRHDFRDEVEILCFDQAIKDFQHRLDEKGDSQDKYAITPVSPLEFLMIKERARMSKAKSYELTQSDGAFKPTNIPFFEGVAYAIRERSRWPFRKASEKGYLRWTPNIMEPFKERTTPFPLLFYHALEEHVYNYGKIIDWGLSSEDGSLLTSLLSEAAETMKMRGISRFQFAHVDRSQKFIKNLLEEFGFKPIHKIKLLRKEVN